LGDDALAWEVVERLRQAKAWPGEIEFHVVEGGQRLLDALDGRGSLILIDALAPNGDAGRIRRFDWPDTRFEALRPGSTHHLRPAEALLLAASLGILPARVVVWGIEGATFEPHRPMSAAVAAAVPELVHHATAELETVLDQEKTVMHEMSLLRGLLRKIEEIAHKQHARRVTVVRLRLGPLAHIEPEHLREHFAEASKGTLADGARLEIQQTDELHELTLESIDVETANSLGDETGASGA
jgi:hydrogenase maturation protease